MLKEKIEKLETEIEVLKWSLENMLYCSYRQKTQYNILLNIINNNNYTFILNDIIEAELIKYYKIENLKVNYYFSSLQLNEEQQENFKIQLSLLIDEIINE